ncbi:hypothetical protein [Nannocystis pusilla]|uniref:Uncharacterized protein n=1 Tax=Nannocystis pusilla TaxID=889268 RepID=A0ABS7TV49_9BACT|nr:hypothetical protein [Nannocystis pusilla]MBZ5712098.1 hypothetical protein [Nannocystis pusilla]
MASSLLASSPRRSTSGVESIVVVSVVVAWTRDLPPFAAGDPLLPA